MQQLNIFLTLFMGCGYIICCFKDRNNWLYIRRKVRQKATNQGVKRILLQHKKMPFAV